MATLPLIRRLPNTVTQIWYADDASATGLVTDLRKWWDDLASVGPCFGYNPNPSKSWLVTKEDSYSNAVATFEGSNINISTNGHPYLGTALGTDAYINQFVTEKVDTWSREIFQKLPLPNHMQHLLPSLMDYRAGGLIYLAHNQT